MAPGKRYEVPDIGPVGSVVVIELEDTHFRFDSAVFLPEPAIEELGESPPADVITGLDVLRTVHIRARENPNQTVLITGHTDTSGPDAYNITLSEKRASAAYHLLTGEKEPWAELTLGQYKKKDVQQILNWAAKKRGWDCDCGSVDGVIGDLTHTAIRNFKTKYNEDFSQGIAVNQNPDGDFWKAVFDVYMAELQKLMEIDEAELEEYRKALKWADDEKRSVGCGECWPIDTLGRDNFRSSTNRRVEILFFDPKESPSLECHPEPGRCLKDKCALYKEGAYHRNHLPVHTGPRADSTPVFLTIEQPNASNYVRMHSLFAYLAVFPRDSDALRSVQVFKFNEGKLADVSTGKVKPIDCDRDAYFYFSHRGDLTESDKAKRFRKDGSGLPLIGPIHVPCGENPEVRLSIWDQKDWIIVRNVDVGQGRFDAVKMADWNGSYNIGWWGTRKGDGRLVFVLYGKWKEKDQQETWKGVDTASGGGPIPLVYWGKPGNVPMFIGTLSASPTPKVKILLVKNGINVGSYNEIEKGSDNIERNGHHQYDQALVEKLSVAELESPGSGQNALIDALPNPPPRFLLPGDCCWYDQGQTNNCGAFSFAAAMNYWYPYVNNPSGRDGTWFSSHVPSAVNGARTPANIERAAEQFQMYGKDRDAEDLDRARAIKLIKLWLTAGIPILFLSKEYSAAGWWDRLWSYHWKTLVGYDGNAFFMNNSGGNQEGDPLLRDKGFDYDHAPIGNNSNSENNFWDKWKAGGGDIVDKFTSVDECTLIALYPKNVNFPGSGPK